MKKTINDATKVLGWIKEQIGVTIELDDHFKKVKTHKDGSFSFLAMFKDRLNFDNVDYNTFMRFARESPSVSTEISGSHRVRIVYKPVTTKQ